MLCLAIKVCGFLMLLEFYEKFRCTVYAKLIAVCRWSVVMFIMHDSYSPMNMYLSKH